MTFWPTGVFISYSASLLTYYLSSGLAVTITAPTEAQVLASSVVDVQWTFAPGTQATYRVVVYASDGVTIVYDSGVVFSAALNHTIPEGSLVTGQTYKIKVFITTTVGTEGESDLRTVTTAWAPSVNILNVRTSTIGAVCELGHFSPPLPGVRIRWNQVVPSGTETFIRYSVWRKLGSEAETAWIRIASVTAIGTLFYDDFTLHAREVYVYAVTWTAQSTVTANYLTSARQNPPIKGGVDFDYAFLHDVSSPTHFVMLPSFDIAITEHATVEFVRLWGRTQPTAFPGGDQYREASVRGLPATFTDGLWEAVEALLTRQRESGAVLCLRTGVSKHRLFSNISAASRQDGQKQHAPQVDVVEIAYAEAVE